MSSIEEALTSALTSALLDESICSTEEEARIVARAVLDDAMDALLRDTDADIASDATLSDWIDGVAIPASDDGDDAPMLALASRCTSELMKWYVDASSPIDDGTDDVASACEIMTRSVLESCGLLLPRDRSGDGEGVDDRAMSGSESDGDEGMVAAAADDDDSETEEYIGEGECELCERSMPLTKHHLIPKSTYPRMKKRIYTAIACRDPAKKDRILDGLPDVPGDLTRSSVGSYLARQTCMICRPCHSMVHRLHDEMELAENYNTIEKLWEDGDVVRFCSWARKQRTGRRVHAGKLQYSR